MSTEKPKTWNELKRLYDNGDIEILLQDDNDDGTTRLLVLDHRRTIREGEIYELNV